jgi:hypothetical protein
VIDDTGEHTVKAAYDTLAARYTVEVKTPTAGHSVTVELTY